MKNEKLIKLKDLHPALQLQIRQKPFEIDKVNKQNTCLVRRALEFNGKIYDAELVIGNCDIRASSEHDYDDTIGVFFNQDGRETDPRVYSRDKAADLYATQDLDELYVRLTPRLDSEVNI